MLHALKEREIDARMMVGIGESFIELSFVGCVSGTELNHYHLTGDQGREDLHAHLLERWQAASEEGGYQHQRRHRPAAWRSTIEFLGPLLPTFK